jgi:MoxR-like ATPase
MIPGASAGSFSVPLRHREIQQPWPGQGQSHFGETRMKTIEWQGKHLALLRDLKSSNGAPPERLLAHERVALFSTPLAGGTLVDVAAFLAQVRQLGQEIKAQLVAMDEEVDLILTALLSGDTVFFLSLPGAAKTTLARLVAKGVGGKFFRRNLTPDTSQNDLFGPLDPAKVQHGVWGRKLSGVATAAIASIDECFKGSGPVQQMLLDAFEEHVLAEPDAIHHLPLLLGITASNELVNDRIENAFWDRLIIRKVVEYPRGEDAWESLLTSTHGSVPIQTRLDPEDVMLVQGLVDYRAADIPAEVRKRMVRIKMQLETRQVSVSPRHFLAWARVSTARALLLGEPHVTPRAIAVGEHLLWVSKDDIPAVRDVVRNLSDPQRGVLRAVEADLENILANIHTTSQLSELVHWQKTISKHEAALKKVIDPEHQAAKEAMHERMREASSLLVARSADLMEVAAQPSV